MAAPLTIAAYPRSGSTWLRFILCHLHYPGVAHNFASVNRHIPTLESDAEMAAAIKKPRFYKTHCLRSGRVIHLVRHVGDALVSEYYFQCKFYGYGHPLSQFIKENEYGANWRKFVNHYAGRPTIKYEHMLTPAGLLAAVKKCAPRHSKVAIQAAIAQCTFAHLQALEKKEPFAGSAAHINFVRSGTAGQWQQHAWAAELLARNADELELMGYI